MRINTGLAVTVTATEYWLSQIRAGRAFTRGQRLGASVGNYSEFQLFNPAGSGVAVIARAIIVSVEGTTQIVMATHNVALATLQGAGVNLLSGGAAGAGAMRTAQPAAQDGTTFAYLTTPSSTPYQPAPDWFMELGEGEGLIVMPNLVNTAITVTFAWVESP